MATEIYFRNSAQLTVRESIDELGNMIENMGNKPIPVTSYYGNRTLLNWANVLHIEDRSDLDAPGSGGSRIRR